MTNWFEASEIIYQEAPLRSGSLLSFSQLHTFTLLQASIAHLRRPVLRALLWWTKEDDCNSLFEVTNTHQQARCPHCSPPLLISELQGIIRILCFHRSVSGTIIFSFSISIQHSMFWRIQHNLYDLSFSLHIFWKPLGVICHSSKTMEMDCRRSPNKSLHTPVYADPMPSLFTSIQSWARLLRARLQRKDAFQGTGEVHLTVCTSLKILLHTGCCSSCEAMSGKTDLWFCSNICNICF